VDDTGMISFSSDAAVVAGSGKDRLNLDLRRDRA
jgi:hypothetical protein